MKRFSKVVAALLGAAFMVALCPAGVANATEVNTYTYNYDYWGIEYESPDAYEPVSYTDGRVLGTTALKGAQSIYIRDNHLFVADTGNNRLLELSIDGSEITLVREITAVVSEELEVKELLAPQDMFLAENGDIFIADTGNFRVLHVDKDLNVQKVILLPNDPTVDQEVPFEPTRLVTDRSGRVFVLAKNVNKGFMEFEANGDFIGFTGANDVMFNMGEYLKKVFSTKAQRDQMASFVPTEYNNLYIDDKAFVYCTTAVFEDEEVISGDCKPIRKLNSLGDDILIRNGEYYPVGDLDWDDAAGMNGPSRLVDVTAFDNETYYAVDRVRNRIFGYDEQGHLLYCFGGVGNKLGYFQLPSSIDHMGTDLFVLDSITGGITRFSMTEFGRLIHTALDLYKQGDYDTAAVYWEQVLQLNGNYDLAYIGIGRSLLRQKDYEGAMEYFKTKRDPQNYSRAWKYYRKHWIEDNLGYVILILIALILIPGVIKFIKKIRREAAEEYEFERELEKQNQ